MINLHIYPAEFNLRAYRMAKHTQEFFTDIIILGKGKPYKVKNANNIKFINFTEKNILIWFFRIYQYSKKKNIRIINCHHVSCLPICFFLKIIHDAKIIYDTHELETKTYSRNFLKNFLAILIERLFINFCEHIFVVSELIAIWYKNKYKLKSKPLVVTNVSLNHHFKKNNYFRKKFKIKKKKKIFLYSGSLNYKGRNIQKILDIFSTKKNSNLVLIFMGDGEEKEKIIHYAKKYKNIFYHSKVSPYSITKYSASADFGLLLIENNSLSLEYCLPNKLFEYISSGLILIGSDLKEIRKFIHKYKCGILIKNFTKGNFQKKIKLTKVSKLRYNSIKAAKINSFSNQKLMLQKFYKKNII